MGREGKERLDGVRKGGVHSQRRKRVVVFGGSEKNTEKIWALSPAQLSLLHAAALLLPPLRRSVVRSGHSRRRWILSSIYINIAPENNTTATNPTTANLFKQAKLLGGEIGASLRVTPIEGPGVVDYDDAVKGVAGEEFDIHCLANLLGHDRAKIHLHWLPIQTELLRDGRCPLEACWS
ncbi:hypothetical protein LguiB_017208 [Lonicera macranthoides]